MIADLKPYTEYKESGLPWLGQVPRHWDVRRLKQVARLAYGDSLPRTGRKEGTVPVFGSNGRVGWHTESNTLAPCIIVGRKGSFGKINFSCDPSFVIDTAFYVDRRIAGVDIRWLFFMLGWLRLDGVSKDSAVPGLDREDAYQRMLTLPSPAEQAAIVRYLDWANGRLERAIRAKRKVIALLNEQKQAIIHRAVTRGLDPSVPLKPSGIPWLGDIPRHWALRRFKFLATINSGQVDPRKPIYRDLVLIAPNHIERGSGRILAQETAAAQGADSGKYLVSRGQVVYSKIRPNLRKATIAPSDCLCSADMYPITPKTRELSAEYFLQLLLSQSFTKFAVDASMRVAMPKVNREALADCPLWFPSVAEQTKIVDFVSRESAPIGNAISRLEREIELLREYRTRLVADVVTGKLDVREAVTRLPEEAALDIAVDDTDLSDETEPADEEAVA